MWGGIWRRSSGEEGIKEWVGFKLTSTGVVHPKVYLHLNGVQ